MLGLCSYLAPTVVPATLLREWLQQQPTPISSEDAECVFDLLQAYSLITYEGDDYQMHRLVQAVLRFYWQQRHPDADQHVIPDVSTLLMSSVRCFNGLFPGIETLDSMVSADYYQKKIYTSHIEMLLSHISEAEKMEPPTMLNERQLERVQLRSALGVLYSLEGNETRALAQHDLALAQLLSLPREATMPGFALLWKRLACAKQAS